MGDSCNESLMMTTTTIREGGWTFFFPLSLNGVETTPVAAIEEGKQGAITMYILISPAFWCFSPNHTATLHDMA